MPRSHVTARNAWGRWVGTLEEVISITHRAMALVEEQSNAVSVNIRVEQPGLTLEYNDANELGQGITSRDLPRIREVGVLVLANTDEPVPLSVAITFDPTGLPAIHLRIAGPDRTAVEGIRTQLVERIDRGSRFPYTAGARVGGALAMITFPGLVIALLGGLVPDHLTNLLVEWSLLAGVSLLILVVGLALALIAAPWVLLFPSFEWLSEDGRTRWDRWHRRVWAGLAAITVTTVSGVLVALLT